MNNPHNIDKERYRRAYWLAAKHYLAVTKDSLRNNILGFGLPAIGSIFVFYVPPLAIAGIISKATSSHSSDINAYFPYVLLFAGSWLLGEALWRIGIVYNIRGISDGVSKLYKEGLRKLLRKDIGFFQDNFAGSLTKKTLGYANRYIDATDTLVYDVFPSIIPAIFALIVLFFFSPFLTLLLITWLVFTLWLVIPRIKKRRQLVTAREIASNVVSGHVADVYGNIEAVRSHASEKLEQKRHNIFVADYIKKLRYSWYYQNRYVDLVISPIYVLSNASGLLLALYLATHGKISFASVIVVFSYYGLVTQFYWRFNGIYRRLEAALSDAAQFTELLLDEPLIHDPEQPVKNPTGKGEIDFFNVNFTYEENDSALFSDFNLNIQSGEKVGLIGRSGGGKTSVTKLLLRFSDIDSGAITIDGVAIDQMTQEELRSYIGYVPQDPAMFHRSIKENIAYGRPNASETEIVEAAKKAHAHEFIKSLPSGYETLVGERGVKLSGGQRQRIAIARAILKDAPILLLDEATSALDSESESLIQDALKKLMKERTAIVIAHRLSTIQKLDRIIVMEKGEIIEEGNHRELLATGGVYAKLWAHQSGGFLED